MARAPEEETLRPSERVFHNFRHRLAPIVFLLLLTSAWAFLAPTAVWAQPLPAVTLDSAEDFLGETVRLTAGFSNAGASAADVGYGPYLDVELPSTPEPLEFLGAHYLDQPITPQIVTLDSNGSAQHPFALDATGNPVILRGPPNGRVAVLVLPFGSVVPNQPTIEVGIELRISPQAEPGENVTVSVTPGFRYGADSLDNPLADPQLRGAPAGGAVRPLLHRLAKRLVAPDGDTPVGESFTRSYQLELELAGGQRFEDLVFTDVLPPALVLRGGSLSLSGMAGLPAYATSFTVHQPGTHGSSAPLNFPAANTGPYASSEFTLALNGPVLTPAGAPTRLVLAYDFYIPAVDANGQPAGTPAVVDAQELNTALLAGRWTGNAGTPGGADLASSATARTRISNTENQHPGDANGTLRLQKWVSSTPSGGFAEHAYVVPGQQVRYRLDFQVSDVSAFQDVTIEDVLPDGLEFVGGMELSYTRRGTTVTHSVAPGVSSSGAGAQRLFIDVSAALAAAPYGGRLLGSCVDDAFGGLVDDCVQRVDGSTQGTITYTARVLQSYRSQTAEREHVLQNDHLRNEAEIRGEILNVTTGAATGWRDSDPGHASVSIDTLTTTKVITHVAGDAVTTTTPPVKNGDAVTFRLTTDLPALAFKDLVVSDYLPLPVFRVPSSMTFIGQCAAGAQPPVGSVCYASGSPFVSDLSGRTVEPSGYDPLTVPTVTTTPATNSFHVDFGSAAVVGGVTPPSRIDLLATLEVADTALADGLYITNLVRASDVNSSGTQSIGQQIVQLRYTRPQLNISNGVIAVGGNSAFDGSAQGLPVSVAEPLVSGSARGQRRDAHYDQNVAGLDAGDIVTFLVIVENVGSGRDGAYDLRLVERLPAGLTPADVIPGTLSARLGTNAPVTLPDGAQADLFGTGMVLAGNVLARGTDENGAANATGSNILYLTYDVRLPASVETAATYTVRSEVAAYAAAAGGANLTASGLIVDDASVSIVEPALVKSVIATSEAHTSETGVRQVAIGEIVRYRLSVSVPEGRTTNLVLTDTLVNGLRYLPGASGTGVRIMAVSQSAGSVVLHETGGGAPLTPPSATAAPSGVLNAGNSEELPTARVAHNGSTLTLSLGDVLNGASDVAVEQLIVEFDVLVLNTSANSGTAGASSSSRLKNNSFGAAAGPAGARRTWTSPAAQVRVFEPNLAVSKTANVTGVADAGAEIVYTVTVANSSTNSVTGFDLLLTDELPEHVAYVSHQITQATLAVNAAASEAGGTVTLTADSLAPGGSIALTISARLTSSVPSGATMTNTANLTASSLPGTNGTGGVTPGAPGSEQGERLYERSGSADMTARALAPRKGIVSTSESASHSGDVNVVVGEVIRYRVSADIPEGVNNAFAFIDTLPDGLVLIDPAQVRVGFVGTDLDVHAELAGAMGGGGSCGALTAPTAVLPASRITTSGNVVTFDLGDVANNSLDDSPACVVLEYNARVADVSTVHSEVMLRNSVTVRANGRTSRPVLSGVWVWDAALRVRKSVAAAGGGSADGADAGDPVVYTITISNTDPQTAPAFDLLFTDELPAELTNVSYDVTPAGAATFTLVGRTLTISAEELLRGRNMTVTVSGELVNDLPPGTTVSNTVSGTWTSLPGSGTPADENATGSASSNERTYGPISDTATFTGRDLGLSKGVQASSEAHASPGGVAIGEVIRYRITVPLPEGVAEQLTVRDTLPTGMEPVGAAGVRAALVTDVPGAVTASSLSGVNEYTTLATLPAVLADGNSALLGAGVASFSGNALTVTLGNVSNAATAGAATEYLVLEYNAVVLDDPANTEGTTLVNAASVALGADVRATATATVAVREPVLTISKAALHGNREATLASTGPAGLINADRGETLTYSVTLTNSGTAAAHSMVITDAIPTGLTLTRASVTRPDGTVDTLTPGASLIVPQASLEPGESVVVEYDVLVGNALAYGQLVTNTASFTATSVQDAASNPGNTTGSDAGPGREHADSDNATVQLAEPTLALAKQLTSGPTVDDLGEYDLSFAFRVRNTGAVTLSGVRVVDDLAQTFAGSNVEVVTATITGVTVAGTTVTGAANAAYDGTTVTDLVVPGTLTLAPSAEAVITLQLRVRLLDDTDLGSYDNIAVAHGSTPGGIPADPVSSSDGTDPEGPVTPTPVTFGEAPALAVTKALQGTPTSFEDGRFRLTYRLSLSNTGDVPLRSLQAVDTLTGRFGGPVSGVSTSIVSVSTGSAAALSTTYNGGTQPNLLDPAASHLAVGGGVVIDVTFTVAPANSGVRYDNVASASGVSPLGQDATGSATEGVTFPAAPALVIGTCEQGMTAVTPRGTFELQLVVRLRNTGDLQLANTQATLDLSSLFVAADSFNLDSLSVITGGVSANPSYGTAGDWNLLAPGITLHTAGQNAADASQPDYVELLLELTVVPGARLDYTVAAGATGESPLHAVGASATVSASATDWCDPTVAPGPTPTTIVFSDDPSLGLAKRFVSLAAVPGASGVFDVTFEFVLRNYGDAQLNDITLTDDFAAVFDDGSVWTITSISATGTLLAADPATAGTNLLAPDSYLGSQGQNSNSGTVSVTLRVTPTTPSRIYENRATAAGVNPGGTTAADASVDGDDPDANGNGNPNDDTSPTPFTFESPSIGVAKSAPATFDFGAGAEANPRNLGDGRYEVAYLFTLGNYGDVPLSDLTLTDDLLGQLAGATPTNVRAQDGTLLANAAYDGAGASNVLAAGQTLGYSATQPVTGTVYVVVTLTPGAALASGSLQLTNEATTSGMSPGGQVVTDDSNEGVDPDNGQPDGDDPANDGDGDPTNNGGVTTVTLTEAPRIAIAKQLTGVENLHDGTYSVSFTLTVANIGDVNLAQVQVSDDLASAFRGVPVTLVGLTATAPLTAATDLSAALASGELLDAAASSLAVGESGSVALTVVVQPGAEVYGASFENSAVAEGTSPAGTRVNDTSNDGATPDPDEESSTPIVLTEAPLIGVAKSVPATFDFGAGPEANPRNLADGTHEVAYLFTIGNYGDVLLSDLSLTDDVATQLAVGGPTAFRTVDGTLNANTAWDGTAATDLLAAGQSLVARTAAGPTIGTVYAVVTLQPGAALVSGSLELSNQAAASGTSPGLRTVSDDSNAGVDPDSGQPDGGDTSLNGDGDPTNNAGPTTVTLREAPLIGVAKRVVGSVNLGDGRYQVEYAFVIENQGDVNLTNVTLEDAFGATFRGAPVTITALTATAPLTAATPAQAQANGQLLDGAASALAVGESGNVNVTVVAVPSGRIHDGPFLNSATARGTSPSTAVVSDVSNDGTTPVAGEESPSPVLLTERPVLGVAKAASVTPVGDGRFDVRFVFTLTNYGDVELRGLQLTDDLVAAFGAGNYRVLSLYSPTLRANTVAPDPANPQAFDGAARQALLAGTDTLPRGASASVELRVRVTPDHLGRHENQARGSATSPGERPVADDSTDGLNPDPNGDGDPRENVPTPVVFSEAPRIGLAKSASVVMNDDGTFNVVLTFTVRNMGDVPLRGVQISDPLTGIYTITDLTPERVTAESSHLTVNPRYDGAADANVLAGTDALAVGAERQVSVRLERVRPVSATSTTNSALASGNSPNGTRVEDRSTDGFEPDPNGDGDPREEVPTRIEFRAEPRIAIAKRAALGVNADGSYDVSFTLTVANVGSTSLHGVQVRDDLAEYFAGTDLTPARLSVSSGRFAVNPAFDGRSDARLLRGTDSLPVGARGAITITLTGIRPTANAISFANSAVADARGPTGTPTTDRSNDGTEPIPGRDVPTVTELQEVPLLGVAKSAATVQHADGSYTLTFGFVLRNYGNVALLDLSLTDDLADFYADAGLIAANVAVSSPDLPVNSGFDGAADTELLGSGANLAVGATARVTLTLSGLSVGQRTAFTNQADAGGHTPRGTPTPPERSTNGTDPDPNGDGDPTNDSEPTPVELTVEARLGVAKRARTAVNADGSHRVEFTLRLVNMGNAALLNLSLTDDLGEFYAHTDLTPAAVSVASSDFAVNAAFDGLTDTELLAPGVSLPVGASGSVTLVLDPVTPTTRTEFTNLAVGAGQTPNGEPVTDDSQDGTNPDPDGDGDPTNNDTPTPVRLVSEPRIGVAKRAAVTANADGSFDVTFDFVIGNYGNAPLVDVQLRDDLTTFYDLTDLAPEDLRVTSPDFAVNAGFDGAADPRLLAPGNTLGVGRSGTLTLVLVGVRVNSVVDTYNTAVGTATDPSGTPAPPDLSHDGPEPDGDGDGDPNNDSDPTPVRLGQVPALGLAKAAEMTRNDAGGYDIRFTLLVRNYGDVPLADLSITDPLADFYAATDLSAERVSVSSTDLSVNAAYDGRGDAELLAPGNRLDVGASATVVIELRRVVPNAGVTRVDNLAYASGTAPDGTEVSDTSTDGSDPDPDGRGAWRHSEPTPVLFAEQAAVLLTKTVAPGPYGIGDRVPYVITIVNPNDVAVAFDLLDELPAGTAYLAGTASFEDAALTPLDGSEPHQDEAGTIGWRSIVVPAGAQVSVSYTLRVQPGATGPLVNRASVAGASGHGAALSATASAVAELKAGVFEQERGLLIGRVYLDVDGDDRYREGVDVPLEGVRVVLSNGWQTLTDAQGNYAFRDLAAGTWTVMVDRVSAPYRPSDHPEQLRDERQHIVTVRGLTVSDFPFLPPAGIAASVRETTVRFGPITLVKRLAPLPDAVRVILEVTSDGTWPPVLITDPVAGEEPRTFVVTPGEPAVITYDLPPGAELTDPTIEWSER